MEKVYPLLNWLTMSQALDWLRTLTGSDLTESILLELCESKRCEVHTDIDGFYGLDHAEGGEVSGQGIQKVLTPKYLKHAGTDRTIDIVFEGPVIRISDTEEEEEEEE